MKTFMMKPKEMTRDWYLIDANDLSLGRLAVVIADLLRGKNKSIYTPHIDCGDYVVIINAEKVALTGKKRANKTYYKHTGHPGGLKSVTAEKVLDGKHPERVILSAVSGMLAKNTLANAQIKKLYVYAGAEHKHTAQNPTSLDVASLNKKNIVN